MMAEVKEVRGSQSLGHSVRVDVVCANSDRENGALFVQPAEEVMLLRNVTR